MAIPELYPVDSSSIASLGYDVERQIAYVQFHNGSLYKYSGVPEREFMSLRAAPSIGAYLNWHFKDIYPYERIYLRLL